MRNTSVKMILTVFVICAITSITGLEEDCAGCGYPGLPANAHFVGIKPEVDRDFDTGFVVTYKCEEPFKLVGDSQRTCECGGRWNGSLPHCENIMEESSNIQEESSLNCYVLDCCSSESDWNCLTNLLHPCKIPNIPHASRGVIIRDKSGTVNLVLECKDGYYFHGESIMTCSQDGIWSEAQSFCVVDSDLLPGQVSADLPMKCSTNSSICMLNDNSSHHSVTEASSKTATNLSASDSVAVPDHNSVQDPQFHDSSHGLFPNPFNKTTTCIHPANIDVSIDVTTMISRQHESSTPSIREALAATETRNTIILSIAVTLFAIIVGILIFIYVRRRRSRRSLHAESANSAQPEDNYEEVIPMAPTIMENADNPHVYESIHQDLNFVTAATT